MMTKKDFELIARVLRARYDSYKPKDVHSPVSGLQLRKLVKDTHKAAAIGDTIRAFASELRATNPRFDPERFVAACMSEDAGRKARS